MNNNKYLLFPYNFVKKYLKFSNRVNDWKICYLISEFCIMNEKDECDIDFTTLKSTITNLVRLPEIFKRLKKAGIIRNFVIQEDKKSVWIAFNKSVLFNRKNSKTNSVFLPKEDKMILFRNEQYAFLKKYLKIFYSSNRPLSENLFILEDFCILAEKTNKADKIIFAYYQYAKILYKLNMIDEGKKLINKAEKLLSSSTKNISKINVYKLVIKYSYRLKWLSKVRATLQTMEKLNHLINNEYLDSYISIQYGVLDFFESNYDSAEMYLYHVLNNNLKDSLKNMAFQTLSCSYFINLKREQLNIINTNNPLLNKSSLLIKELIDCRNNSNYNFDIELNTSKAHYSKRQLLLLFESVLRDLNNKNYDSVVKIIDLIKNVILRKKNTFLYSLYLLLFLKIYNMFPTIDSTDINNITINYICNNQFQFSHVDELVLSLWKENTNFESNKITKTSYNLIPEIKIENFIETLKVPQQIQVEANQMKLKNKLNIETSKLTKDLIYGEFNINDLILDNLNQLAIKSEDSEGISNFYVLNATYLSRKGKYNEALNLCNLAIEINNKCTSALIISGGIYIRLTNYSKALSIFESVLSQPELKIDDMIKANANIGNIYLILEQFDKALQYYETVQTISESLENKNYKFRAKYNFANYHYIRQNYALALEICESFFAEIKFSEDMLLIFKVLQLIGDIQVTYLKDYNSGIKYYKNALEIANNLDYLATIKILISLGDTHLKILDINKALFFFKQAQYLLMMNDDNSFETTLEYYFSIINNNISNLGEIKQKSIFPIG